MDGRCDYYCNLAFVRQGIQDILTGRDSFFYFPAGPDLLAGSLFGNNRCICSDVIYPDLAS